MSRTYSANGLANDILSAMEQGPASFAELRQAVRNERRRRKAFYVLTAMREDGLVERVACEAYALTDEGREALEELRAGRDVICGARVSFRVFARAA